MQKNANSLAIAANIHRLNTFPKRHQKADFAHCVSK